MKYGTFSVLVLTLCALMLPCVAGGCASTTPQQEWTIAAQTYTSTLKILTTLKKAGYLSDEDKTLIEPFRAAARAAVDEMERAAFTDDSTGMQDAQTAFRVALVALSEFIAKGYELQDIAEKLIAEKLNATNATDTTNGTEGDGP